MAEAEPGGGGGTPVPRGRHAPPPEVRSALQRRRLLGVAATVFAREGYASASAERIAREAGMSKATFYEHFGNKEDCIVALWDTAAEVVMGAMTEASSEAGGDLTTRRRARTHAFLSALAAHPDAGQTLFVEIIGAGPRVAGRRDQIISAFAALLQSENTEGGGAGFASPLDAVAVVGAISELVSRHMRLGEPADVWELEPVIERLMTGMLGQPR